MANKKLCKTLKIVAGAAGVAFVGMRLIAKKKKADYTYKNESTERNPFEGRKVVFVKDENDAENADGVRGHLEDAGISWSIRCRTFIWRVGCFITHICSYCTSYQD